MQYTNPELEQKWEYVDNQKNIQSGFPSIALWAWNAQGFLPKDLMIRRVGTENWIALINALNEINEITRMQFTKLLFLNKKWHYIGNDGNIHGPFEGDQMMVYAYGGYFSDDCQLLAVNNDQRIQPEMHMFKTFKTYLIELMQSQEITLQKNEDEVGNIPDFQLSNDNDNFEELKKYATTLFSNPDIDWYSAVESQMYGPFKNNEMIAWINAMPPTYMICCVQPNSPEPDLQTFESFKDHLIKIHNTYN